MSVIKADPCPEVPVGSVEHARALAESTAPAKRGCLLINLGSPAAPKPRHIRAFLRKFLSDRRVINLPSLVWKPILYGIILTVRPRKIAPVYRSIWTDTGSPLMVYSLVHERLAQEALGPDVMVRIAMSYAEPSIETALTEMLQAGVKDLTVISLYPQFAASTVASCYDTIFRFLMKQSSVPTLRIIRSWEVEGAYINAYARKINAELDKHEVDGLLLSYHSVPQQEVHTYAEYQAHCNATTAAIHAELSRLRAGKPMPRLFETFQSKFGPGKWIEPATITTMAQLPNLGVKRLMVATPGFVADCIETLDEIAVLNREEFEKAGGESFHVVASLNDDAEVGNIIADIYRRLN